MKIISQSNDTSIIETRYGRVVIDEWCGGHDLIIVKNKNHKEISKTRIFKKE